MTRPPLLLAVLGLALAAPLADAQFASSLTMVANPPSERLMPEAVLSVGGMVTYTADNTVLLNMNGVPVRYQVINAPQWATVVVSPQQDVLPVPMPVVGLTTTVSRAFTITLVGSPDWGRDETALVEILAVATPQAPGARSESAAVTIPVTYDAQEKEEPCHEAPIEEIAVAYLDAYAATEPAQDAPEDGETTIQSSASTPLAGPVTAGVLGFGAAGAGVGLLMRKRRG